MEYAKIKTLLTNFNLKKMENSWGRGKFVGRKI